MMTMTSTNIKFDDPIHREQITFHTLAGIISGEQKGVGLMLGDIGTKNVHVFWYYNLDEFSQFIDNCISKLAEERTKEEKAHVK